MNVESKVLSLLDRNKIEYNLGKSDIMVRCLNPLHEDSSPSMGIDRITGRYYCFSCSFGGQLTKLLELFGEKVEANLLFSIKQELILEKIQKIKAANVKLPDGLVPFTGNMGNCGKVTMAELDAFTCSESELLNRVCFPVYVYGKLKFIEARALDDTMRPRWLRYPAGVDVNFVINREVSKSLVIVEGYSDYANMFRLGIKNVSPLFGSQNFSTKKLESILEAGIQKLIVFTDNDDAGWDAFNKISAIVKGRLQVKRLVPATDPGDIIDGDELLGYTDAARLNITKEGIII